TRYKRGEHPQGPKKPGVEKAGEGRRGRRALSARAERALGSRHTRGLAVAARRIRAAGAGLLEDVRAVQTRGHAERVGPVERHLRGRGTGRRGGRRSQVTRERPGGWPERS